MNEDEVLSIMTKILAGASLLQSIEYLQLHKHFRPGAAWDWDLLQRNFDLLPEVLHRCLTFFCGSSGFLIILWFRLGYSVLLWVDSSPWSLLILLITSVLVAIRSLGTFNGGSDSMTLMLLAVLLFARVGETSLLVQQIAIIYIAIQSVLSYFLAGCAKLCSPSWREGWAIPKFLEFPAYYVPKIFSTKFVSSGGLGGKLLCWAVLGFECSLPIALVDIRLCWFYLSLASIFHVLIFFTFGLNRFVFVWITTYPALLYVSAL